MIRPHLLTFATAVANAFIPGNPETLHHLLRVSDNFPILPLILKALIVPHVGMFIQAPLPPAYNAFFPFRCHSKSGSFRAGASGLFAGMAIPSSNILEPLGLDSIGIAVAILKTRISRCEGQDLAHAQEHSPEVHLPFLQEILTDFTLVPLVVGETQPLVEAVWSRMGRGWNVDYQFRSKSFSPVRERKTGYANGGNDWTSGFRALNHVMPADIILCGDIVFCCSSSSSDSSWVCETSRYRRERPCEGHGSGFLPRDDGTSRNPVWTGKTAFVTTREDSIAEGLHHGRPARPRNNDYFGRRAKGASCHPDQKGNHEDALVVWKPILWGDVLKNAYSAAFEILVFFVAVERTGITGTQKSPC